MPTEAVVDRLETVEIDHREGAGRRRVADPLEERRPVRDPAQRVGEHGLLQRTLHCPGAEPGDARANQFDDRRAEHENRERVGAEADRPAVDRAPSEGSAHEPGQHRQQREHSQLEEHRQVADEVLCERSHLALDRSEGE